MASHSCCLCPVPLACSQPCLQRPRRRFPRAPAGDGPAAARADQLRGTLGDALGGRAVQAPSNDRRPRWRWMSQAWSGWRPRDDRMCTDLSVAGALREFPGYGLFSLALPDRASPGLTRPRQNGTVWRSNHSLPGKAQGMLFRCKQRRRFVIPCRYLTVDGASS